MAGSEKRPSLDEGQVWAVHFDLVKLSQLQGCAEPTVFCFGSVAQQLTRQWVVMVQDRIYRKSRGLIRS